MEHQTRSNNKNCFGLISENLNRLKNALIMYSELIQHEEALIYFQIL